MATGDTIWPQHKAFKRRVEEYKNADPTLKKTLKDVAEDLEISQAYLQNCLYGQKKLGDRAARRAALLFRCDVSEFIDDPAAQIEGLDPGDMTQLSAAKRAVMNMMFQRVRREDVTDEEALEYYNDLMYLVERGKVRKPRWE